MQAILELVVERDDDIVSAAVRRADGSLAVQVGDHARTWQPLVDGQSTPTQVAVPIQANNEQWGQVELAFRPMSPPGWWGYVASRPTIYVVFIGTVTFLLSSFYLRKTLQHVDPSKVVPGRVRSALDTLAEGLLVLDDSYRIMLANQSLAEIVGEAPERLVGRVASELPWASSSTTNRLEYPWETAIRERSTAGRRDDAPDRSGRETPLVHGQLHADSGQRREDPRRTGQPRRRHAAGGDADTS